MVSGGIAAAYNGVMAYATENEIGKENKYYVEHRSATKVGAIAFGTGLVGTAGGLGLSLII